MDRGEVKSAIESGVRTSVRNNVAAYGFSVMITASFGVLSVTVGAPTVAEIFLFGGGAVAGVTVVEGIASRGFKVRMRGEPSEVVALGSSFSFISVGLGVGAAALAGELIAGWPAWIVGPLLATAVYVVGSGVEMALAHAAQERRESEEEKD